MKVITVSCPACAASFPVDPDKVPVGGVNARCSACRHVFRVERPAESVDRPVDPAPSTAGSDAAPGPAAPGEIEQSAPAVAGGVPTFDAGADASERADSPDGGPGAGEAELPYEPELDREPDLAHGADVTHETGLNRASGLDHREELPDWAVAPEPGAEPAAGAVDLPGTADVSPAVDLPDATDLPSSDQPEVEEPGVPLDGVGAAPMEIEPDGFDRSGVDHEGSVPGSGLPTDLPTDQAEPGPAVGGTDEEGGAERPPTGSSSAASAEAAERDSVALGGESGAAVAGHGGDTEAAPADEVSPVDPAPAGDTTPTDPAPAEAATPPEAAPAGFTFGKRDPVDKARRLARVLVSDMVMYNAERHRQALAQGTLAEDFAEEIDKSWREFVDQVGRDLAEGEGRRFWTAALNEILAKGRDVF